MGEGEGEGEGGGRAKQKQKQKQRARPIVRIGIFLISHSNFVRLPFSLSQLSFILFTSFSFSHRRFVFCSVVCFIAGVVALLLLPILAKNTYISENALMPGSANSMLSTHDVSEANKLINELTQSHLTSM